MPCYNAVSSLTYNSEVRLQFISAQVIEITHCLSVHIARTSNLGPIFSFLDRRLGHQNFLTRSHSGSIKVEEQLKGRVANNGTYVISNEIISELLHVSSVLLLLLSRVLLPLQHYNCTAIHEWYTLS